MYGYIESTIQYVAEIYYISYFPAFNGSGDGKLPVHTMKACVGSDSFVASTSDIDKK
jgi:hypothetical protein